jgi:hypothetical protein
MTTLLRDTHVVRTEDDAVAEFTTFDAGPVLGLRACDPRCEGVTENERHPAAVSD